MTLGGDTIQSITRVVTEHVKLLMPHLLNENTVDNLPESGSIKTSPHLEHNHRFQFIIYIQALYERQESFNSTKSWLVRVSALYKTNNLILSQNDPFF